MDTRKILFFIDFLSKEASNKNGLSALYEKAVSSNDEVLTLTSFVEEYTFFQGIGSSLLDRARSLLDKLYRDPSTALSTLMLIKQLNETIQNEVNLCSGLLRSPDTFSDSITVLKKKDRISYLKAYKQIANTCAYLIALYKGLPYLKGLAWPETDGIQESVYTINTKFLPALKTVQKSGCGWLIRKEKMGGSALFEGEFFSLSFDNTKRVEVLCSALHKEAMTTHSFLNIQAYEADEIDVPYCWGTGNILSVSPNNALLLTQKDVVTKLRSPNYTELQRRVPTPFECARILSDGHPFCISPDELTKAMNQWVLGHEIELRKATHNCLFCGKQVPRDRLICKTHFTSEMR